MKIKEQKKLFQQARGIEIAHKDECLFMIGTVNHIPATLIKGDIMEITHAIFNACVECDGLIDILKWVVDAYDNSGIAEKLKSDLDKIKNAN
jgi:hypothetical protein